MTFFCPSCWSELDKNYEHCPSCGCDIKKLSEGQDFVEKLIAALNHPEPETPIRSAWILGRLTSKRAIIPLYDAARKTSDTFLRVEAIKALFNIGTDDANKLAGLCLQSATEMERRLIAESSKSTDSPERRKQTDGNQ